MGFIAMKALSGGLINNSAAASAWMNQFPDVIPIWGIQRESELDEFLSHMQSPPTMTHELKAIIDNDREQLKGGFCRGCGYCMPCPQGIVINTAARMSLLLRRAPTEMNLSDTGREIMKNVENCIGCYQCASKCPYGLDTPELLKRNYEDYKEVLAGKPLLPHNF
jgi:predicted aldo/keto reductase-like oxidoreductase